MSTVMKMKYFLHLSMFMPEKKGLGLIQSICRIITECLILFLDRLNP